MRIVLITDAALLGALLMLCSCGARQRLGQARTVNTNQIPVTSASQRNDNRSTELNQGISVNDAVSVHMITNMDQSERHVFFINPTGSIQDLSPRWGEPLRGLPYWACRMAQAEEQDHPSCQVERVQGDDAEASCGDYSKWL